jgi:hypothetical protein
LQSLKSENQDLLAKVQEQELEKANTVHSRTFRNVEIIKNRLVLRPIEKFVTVGFGEESESDPRR